MQLRVARLCLDCEELHTDNVCPRCASESYAFLSKWLPTEERRRWRRPSGQSSEAAAHGVTGVARSIGRWLSSRNRPTHVGPATRASDHVPQLHFDEVKDDVARSRPLDVELSKNDVR